MSIELKIKNKHLSEEAKIIRFEERKLLKRARVSKNEKTYRNLNSLTQHRKWDVRNENRATSLARAFISGKSYSLVECFCKDIFKRNVYIAPRVISMIRKYHNKDFEAKELYKWFKE